MEELQSFYLSRQPEISSVAYDGIVTVVADGSASLTFLPLADSQTRLYNPEEIVIQPMPFVVLQIARHYILAQYLLLLDNNGNLYVYPYDRSSAPQLVRIPSAIKSIISDQDNTIVGVLTRSGRYYDYLTEENNIRLLELPTTSTVIEVQVLSSYSAILLDSSGLLYFIGRADELHSSFQKTEISYKDTVNTNSKPLTILRSYYSICLTYQPHILFHRVIIDSASKIVTLMSRQNQLIVLETSYRNWFRECLPALYLSKVHQDSQVLAIAKNLLVVEPDGKLLAVRLDKTRGGAVLPKLQRINLPFAVQRVFYNNNCSMMLDLAGHLYRISPQHIVLLELPFTASTLLRLHDYGRKADARVFLRDNRLYYLESNKDYLRERSILQEQAENNQGERRGNAENDEAQDSTEGALQLQSISSTGYNNSLLDLENTSEIKFPESRVKLSNKLQAAIISLFYPTYNTIFGE